MYNIPNNDESKKIRWRRIADLENHPTRLYQEWKTYIKDKERIHNPRTGSSMSKFYQYHSKAHTKQTWSASIHGH
jgi:hypothetical protein